VAEAASGLLGEVALARPDEDFLLQGEVGDLHDPLGDPRQRPVAAVGGQPTRASDRGGGVAAARPEAALAVAPQLELDVACRIVRPGVDLDGVAWLEAVAAGSPKESARTVLRELERLGVLLSCDWVSPGEGI
jgi:hypothetical protein